MHVNGYEDLVENVNVYELEEAMIASGYPMKTTNKNFSEELDKLKKEAKEVIIAGGTLDNIENKNVKRAIKLGNTKIGSGHNTFLNGIQVAFDLRFSNKAWVEMQRYHFIDFVSSASTMHCITKFDLDKSYNEFVDPRVIAIMKEKVDKYNSLEDYIAKGIADDIPIEEAKAMRDKLYMEILYTNPAGFRLFARVHTNYQQLRTIYYQRKNHRLKEWRDFCAWIETLPFFKELALEEN